MIDLYIRHTEKPLSPEAHRLLEEVLARKYGIRHPELSIKPYGKPYLKKGPCFNLSHTHGAVAAAFSETEVGLDMEEIRSYLPTLPKRVLSAGEFSWFQECGELKKDFFTLWTLKESYLKFLGSGLQGFPNGTDFYYDGEWKLRGSDLHFRVIYEKNLVIALCGNHQTEISKKIC